MSVLGVRCHKDKFTFVIVDGSTDAPRIVDHGVRRLPAGKRGEQLTWVRREVEELHRRHGVTAASFKAAETTGTPDASRGEVEGVLQQTLDECGIGATGRRKNQLKSALDLGSAKGAFDDALRSAPFTSVPVDRREALAVAMAEQRA